jgi:hypothetical protein
MNWLYFFSWHNWLNHFHEVCEPWAKAHGLVSVLLSITNQPNFRSSSCHAQLLNRPGSTFLITLRRFTQFLFQPIRFAIGLHPGLPETALPQGSGLHRSMVTSHSWKLDIAWYVCWDTRIAMAFRGRGGEFGSFLLAHLGASERGHTKKIQKASWNRHPRCEWLQFRKHLIGHFPAHEQAHLDEIHQATATNSVDIHKDSRHKEEGWSPWDLHCQLR